MDIYVYVHRSYDQVNGCYCGTNAADSKLWSTCLNDVDSPLNITKYMYIYIYMNITISNYTLSYNAVDDPALSLK